MICEKKGAALSPATAHDIDNIRLYQEGAEGSSSNSRLGRYRALVPARFRPAFDIVIDCGGSPRLGILTVCSLCIGDDCRERRCGLHWHNLALRQSDEGPIAIGDLIPQALARIMGPSVAQLTATSEGTR